MNKRMKKLFTKLGVVLAITTIASTSILANESEEKRNYSKWAIKELNDAMSYGLMDIELAQEDMKCPISEAKYIELCENVEKKIGEIPGVTQKGELTIAMPESGEVTKQDMLDMLYAILTNYEYSTELGIDTTDVSSCMTALEVVKGNGNSEGLVEACTVEQAVVMSRRFVESTYDLCDADSEGVFWKVESNGNTVYLLGSIHIGKAGMYPIRDEIMDAYESSDEIYTEIGVITDVSKEVQDMMYYADGTTVKDHISEEYYEKLTQLLKDYSLSPEYFGNAKDWNIMLQLPYLLVEKAEESQDLSENDTIGIDSLFQGHAMQDNKVIKSLETAEEHFGAFDIHMSQEVKTYMLEATIEENIHPEGKELELQNIKNQQEKWKNGEIDKSEQEYAEEEMKKLPEEERKLVEEFNKALIDDRDQIMADSIDEALKSEEGKTYFIIAGAAHFESDTGVLTRLEEKGYKVERIK